MDVGSACEIRSGGDDARRGQLLGQGESSPAAFCVEGRLMSTTTVRHTHGPIPTLIDALVPVEHIAGSVERVLNRWELEGVKPDPLPTIEDVGALSVSARMSSRALMPSRERRSVSGRCSSRSRASDARRQGQGREMGAEERAAMIVVQNALDELALAAASWRRRSSFCNLYTRARQRRVQL
jgi:hypothetical protein